MLDGARPTSGLLISRVDELWLPDEEVVYVGLAGPRRSRSRRGELPRRVQEFYETRLGGRSPQAGGWLVKTLGCLDELQVHYGYCENVEEAEKDALAAFAANVSEETRGSLRDPERIMPFANLEFPRGVRKRHGMTGARGPRVTATGRKRSSRPRADRAPTVGQGGIPSSDSASRRHRSQRVTEADIRAGQIRIPKGPPKTILPSSPGAIEVVLCGVALGSCRWDPRPGPDRERSGVIRVGRRRAAELLHAGEPLAIAVQVDGLVVIG